MCSMSTRNLKIHTSFNFVWRVPLRVETWHTYVFLTRMYLATKHRRLKNKKHTVDSLFFVIVALDSRCEIKRAGEKKAKFLQRFEGARFRSRVRTFRWFIFPLLFNFTTVRKHTGGGTTILKRKQKSPNPSQMKTSSFSIENKLMKFKDSQARHISDLRMVRSYT